MVAAPQLREDQIREALTGVLKSSAFRGSKRCQTFLSYVVEHALTGDAEALKERSIAIAVFGRHADVALADDSIVRVGAREVRKRLVQHYSGEGHQDAVRIELPLGTYSPVFEAGPPDVREDPADLPRSLVRPPEWQRLQFFIAAGLAVMACIAAFVHWWPRISLNEPSVFRAFWEPALSHSELVNIALAHPVAYIPSRRVMDQQVRKEPAAAYQKPIDVQGDSIPASDFLPAVDQFVGFGDAMAVHRFDTLFHRHGRQSRIRLATRVDFSDLRDTPTVLVGSFTNRWVMHFNNRMRFRLSHLSTARPGIVDSNTGKEYPLAARHADGSYSEDYLLLGRLANPQVGGFLIVGAGLTQYGTQEAARILADPHALSPILGSLPPGWESRNVELLLRSEIVGDGPGPPTLIASEVR